MVAIICLPGTGILAGNLVDASEGMFEEIEIEASHKAISRGASRQGKGYSGCLLSYSALLVPAILLPANSADESSNLRHPGYDRRTTGEAFRAWKRN